MLNELLIFMVNYDGSAIICVSVKNNYFKKKVLKMISSTMYIKKKMKEMK